MGADTGVARSRATEALLLLAVAVTGMGQTLVFAILPSLGRAANMAEIEVGLIITCSALVFALASPVWGRLSEYIGRRPVLVLGLTGYGIGTLGFALVFQAGINGALQGAVLVMALVVARCLQAAVMAASPPAASAYIADVTSIAQRTRGMGRIGAAHNLGTVVGPAMGGMLAVFSLVLPLYVVVLVSLAMALFVAWRLPESPYISQRPAPAQPFSVAGALRASFASYRDPRLTGILLLGVGMFMTFAVVQQTLGFMYQDRFSLSPAGAAAGVGVAMMAAALSSLLAQAVVVQWLGWAPQTLLRLAMPLMGVGFVLLALAPVPVIAAAGIAVTGLGLGLGMPGISSAASVRVGTDEQGLVAGMMSACPALGFIIGPVLGTGLYQWLPQAPYWLVCVLVLPLIVAAWRVPGHPQD